MSGNGRIARRFAALKEEGRSGLVAFVTAGDPDAETSAKILAGLPDAGADVIELGVAFTDPVGDGPAVQVAGQRALAAGATLRKTLAMVAEFRKSDNDTPIVLMGYYNPIYRYGVDAFSRDAADAGVDGLIVVDLPPEEEAELRGPAQGASIDIIRLVTPTSDDERLPKLLKGVGGFVYYVSVTGVTGAKSATQDTVRAAVERIRHHTDLPVAVGFGITNPDAAAAVAEVADAAVVGSAFVRIVGDNIDKNGRANSELVGNVLKLASDLSAGIRRARD